MYLSTTCCGLYELQNLGEFSSPEKLMKFYMPILVSSNAGAFFFADSDEEFRHNEDFDEEYFEYEWDGQTNGERLAEYLSTQDYVLSVTKTPIMHNPNSGNDIRCWVVEFNAEAMDFDVADVVENVAKIRVGENVRFKNLWALQRNNPFSFNKIMELKLEDELLVVCSGKSEYIRLKTTDGLKTIDAHYQYLRPSKY